MNELRVYLETREKMDPNDTGLLSHLVAKCRRRKGKTNNGDSSDNGGGRVLLTIRQVEIIRLIINGFTNKEIARKLGISPSTVKNHVTEIHARLGIDRRTKVLSRIVELLHA